MAARLRECRAACRLANETGDICEELARHKDACCPPPDLDLGASDAAGPEEDEEAGAAEEEAAADEEAEAERKSKHKGSKGRRLRR